MHEKEDYESGFAGGDAEGRPDVARPQVNTRNADGGGPSGTADLPGRD